MDPNKPMALHLDPKVTNQVPLVIRELGVKPALRLFLAQNHVTDMKTLKPILQVHASAHSRPRGRDLCQGTGGTPGFVLERDETIGPFFFISKKERANCTGKSLVS